MNDTIPVSHREISVAFKCTNEKEQKCFVHYELAKEPKSLLLAYQLWALPLQHHMIINIWKQYFHGVCTVIKERNAT